MTALFARSLGVTRFTKGNIDVYLGNQFASVPTVTVVTLVARFAGTSAVVMVTGTRWKSVVLLTFLTWFLVHYDRWF